MPDVYCQFLDATIQHLELLKARGVRFLVVCPETLENLRQASSRPVVRSPLTPTGPGGTVTQPRPGFASAAAGAASPLTKPKLPDAAPPKLEALPVSTVAALTPDAKAVAFAELR